MNIERRVLFMFLGFCLVLQPLWGCVPTASNVRTQPVENAANKGRISLFLNLHETDGPKLTMQIDEIQLKTELGELVPLQFDSLEVESGTIKDGQIFLNRFAIEPGKYTHLQVTIGQGGVVEDGADLLMPLENSELVLQLRTPLSLIEGDSKSLFLTWDTKKSLVGDKFAPALNVVYGQKKLVADVAYVACPEINTVFMFSTETNRVIDSLGVPGGPTYVLQEVDTPERNVFVLTQKKPQILAFSPYLNRLDERYALTRIINPVYMALSPNGKWAYILDKRLGTVSKMDLTSGAVDQVAQLDFQPIYALYLEKMNLLAVTLHVSEQVVLLDPDTLEQVGAISTGSMPEGIMLFDDRILYIAETGNNSVMVYDLESNQMVQRITVGFRPKRVFHTDHFIYVTNEGESSISIIRFSHLMTSRKISLSGTPVEMAKSEVNNWLYVGNKQEGVIEVIDPLTNEITGSIELGASPQGIMVLQ